MSCQETRELFDAYVDGELDLVQSLDVERHLESCAECHARVAQVEAVRSAVQTDSHYFLAPAGLEKRIRAQLLLPGDGQPQKVPPKKLLGWRLAAFAASIGALAVFTAILVATLWRPSEADTLAKQVVSSHIRSLMANHLADVPSSDQHTVKPWFNGKLDFSPPVKDLKAEGFPLIGGRLDYLDARPVAALLYRRNRHTINLFIWPTPQSDAGSRTFTANGYNVIHWTESGMTYWAVSDLNSRELNEFAARQRK